MTLPNLTPSTGTLAIRESNDVLAIRPTRRLFLRVLRGSQELADNRAAWTELAGEQPFASWEWIAAWWQVYSPSREAVVLVAQDETGRWRGLFPLCIERSRYWGRVLVNMAGGRACSDHVRPMIAPGFESRVLALFASWLDQHASAGTFDLVDWDGVDAGDPAVTSLCDSLAQTGFARHDLPQESSWIAPLPGDWAAFEMSVNKGFRRKLQKARRNEQLPGVEILRLQTPSEIRQHWPTLIRLHEARRESLDQAGCFQEPGFSEFLLAALGQMAERRRASVLLASYEGRPFGMVILLFGGDRAYLYQSGFDPAQRRLEPGHLVLTAALRQAIEKGQSHFDFLRGDEPYKARWNAEPQPLVRVRLVPNRWLPRWRMKLWSAARSLKLRLRPSRLAPRMTPIHNPAASSVQRK
jgi:CelD/BcsL family acetyltransferase involved in cellulose biosynthesis